MFKRLAAAFLLRRLVRDLTRVADSLTAQTALLSRLADRFAPVDPPTERAEVRTDTGVTHLDPTDAALALDFVERTARQTGHIPDDDEILIHLADEKTVDLQQRLIEREQQLARLREDRA
jgi:hypothetical protein